MQGFTNADGARHSTRNGGVCAGPIAAPFFSNSRFATATPSGEARRPKPAKGSQCTASEWMKTAMLTEEVQGDAQQAGATAVHHPDSEAAAVASGQQSCPLPGLIVKHQLDKSQQRFQPEPLRFASFGSCSGFGYKSIIKVCGGSN